MRLLFSSTPAFGHLLPLVPFARAAIEAGHEVAVLTGADMRPFVSAELPGAEFLEAGASAATIIGTAAIEDGVDLTNVGVEGAAAMFGRVRVKLGLEQSLAAAAAWQPDAVLSEVLDRIGPIVAGGWEVPWVQFGVGPGDSEVQSTAVREAAEPFARERGIVVAHPLAYVEACPPSLKPEHWSIDVPIVEMRTEPFRSARGPAPIPELGAGRRASLVTFGTIFSDPTTLGTIVDSVAQAGYEVLATEGLLLSEVSTRTSNERADERIHWVKFEPLADLLRPVDVVVSAGGSGTVFASLAEGKPLVLFPQGADQYSVSALAERAGVAVVVDSTADVPEAVSTALHDESIAASVQAAQAEIAAMPTPEAAVANIVKRLRARL